ncbi:MAG: EamA family transporter [Crocinitomicaceae bacterium]|nr:EamA family transporter [Crocinitomicaceae bacterium]
MKLIGQYKDHISLHFIILIWGFTGILGKLISLPYYSIVIYRMGIAFLGLCLYLYIAKKPFEKSFKKIALFILVGVIVGAHWATFFQAIKVSNVSVTLTTLASTSLFVAFLEPLFFRRRIIWYEVVLGLMVIFGLYLIFSFEVQYKLGITLALISAMLAALFGTINGRLVQRAAPGQITMYEMLGGVLGMSCYTFFFENVEGGAFSPSMLDVFYLLVLGLICTAFAFVISIQVMRVLSPYTVSVSINMEPIYAIILALIFFGESEKMTLGFYAGAALILGTVIGNGVLKSYFRNKAIGK